MRTKPRLPFRISLLLAAWLPSLWLGRPAMPARLQAQQDGATPTPVLISILTPLAGKALQGVVPVMVNTQVEGFMSSELYFGYAENPTGTWFLVERRDYPLDRAAFALWDTTTITDGDYTLRLVVTRYDQEPLVLLVEGLRVRNYSPIETDTPTPSPTPLPGDMPTQTATPAPTHTVAPPTPTPLPTNPAILGGMQMARSVGWGALTAFGVLGVLGLYLAWRQRRSD